LLCVLLFYWIKILRDFRKASSNFKEVSENLKEKLASFSGIAAGLTVLVEKIIKTYSKKKQKSKGPKQKEENNNE